ncbi:MAG: hypothetical protein KDA28_09605, partial [Phycisphaerales bacterium]|nr:hypothetical protein [Phycisphaerales bacterium]
MNRALAFAFACAISPSFVACAVLDTGDQLRHPDQTAQTLPSDFWDDAPINGNTPIARARLEGDMGPVSGLNDDAFEAYAWSENGWSSVTVTVDSTHGAAMAIVDFYGDATALVGRGVQVYDGSSWGAEDVSVSVIGCSGNEVGYWDFDTSAQEVEVEVTEVPADPTVLSVRFEATFPDYVYGAYECFGSYCDYA